MKQHSLQCLYLCYRIFIAWDSEFQMSLALPIIEQSAAVGIEVSTADEVHLPYAREICLLIEQAAAARGTGIAKRQISYIQNKIKEGKAVIALGPDGDLAGFCYIETWDHGKYAANSGLIVAPRFRRMGLARRIKRHAFELSRLRYPDSKLFGITTSLPVMKINSDLGYRPVTFNKLTDDDEFWKGCESCPNHDVLVRMNRKMCLCTGMLYDPETDS